MLTACAWVSEFSGRRTELVLTYPYDKVLFRTRLRLYLGQDENGREEGVEEEGFDGCHQKEGQLLEVFQTQTLWQPVFPLKNY